MDRPVVVRVDPVRVQGVPEHVVDMTQGPRAHRRGDGPAGVPDRGSPDQAVGRPHGDGTYCGVTDVLGNLAHDRAGLAVQGPINLPREVDLREIPWGEV